MKPEPRYFGCHTCPGHFWWAPGMQRPHPHRRQHERFDAIIDGSCCPPGPEVEGVANVVRMLQDREPITILAFWDRSVDSRGACNSAFLMPGTLSFAEAVAEARRLFPEVWGRFTFPVVEWRASGGAHEEGTATPPVKGRE